MRRMVRRSTRWATVVIVLGLVLAGCGSSDPGAAATHPMGPVTGLAVDAADGSVLEVGGGLWRSTDQGHDWQAVTVPSTLRPTMLRQVATTAAAPQRLYAAGPGAGIVQSNDGGRSWQQISKSLPSQQVATFAVHSYRPDTVYAWIAGQGVFRTENDGQRWEKMDGGPSAPVAMLAHSTLAGSMNTGWLYAATPQGPYLSMDCF